MNVSSSNSQTGAILLVDDNKLGLIARRAVLEELGYTITTAGSGVEALKQLSEAEFSLIVTDYKMPRMNGDVFIARVREKRPGIPVILLSGFADALGLSEENTGADIVIQKSNNEVTHLVRGVRRLLCRKAPRKPPVSQPPTSRRRHQSG